MADQRTKPHGVNNFFTNRPTTLPITGENFHPSYLLTPGDYTKLLLTTPELDNQARGFTTPELINALSGGIVQFDERNSPALQGLEDLMDAPNHNNRSTNSIMNNNIVQIESTANFPQELSFGVMPRNRSISSANDQDSSNSAIGSSPGRPGDELQNVPSEGCKTGDEEDVTRREKKRERNRQAAQKCRTRKLNRIAELQKRVDELQGKNRNLNSIAETLRGEVSRLEQQLGEHRTNGCNLVTDNYLH